MAISELLNGPDDGERAEGATSLLPPISAPVSVTLGGTPTVTVPFAIRGLPSLAVSQLACTAVAVSRLANALG
jgi:hypothetical protein